VSVVSVVIVVTSASRTVTGALVAAAASTLLGPLVLDGELFGWILRSPDRIPGVFPISSKWMFVLFGLAAIRYARHPAGGAPHVWQAMAARVDRRRHPVAAPATAAAAPDGSGTADGGRAAAAAPASAGTAGDSSPQPAAADGATKQERVR